MFFCQMTKLKVLRYALSVQIAGGSSLSSLDAFFFSAFLLPALVVTSSVVSAPLSSCLS